MQCTRQSPQSNQKKGQKKKYPLSSEPGSQQSQAWGSTNMVVNARPGPLDQNRLAWETTNEEVVVFPDNHPRRTTVGVVESMVGLESSIRTQ